MVARFHLPPSQPRAREGSLRGLRIDRSDLAFQWSAARGSRPPRACFEGREGE